MKMKTFSYILCLGTSAYVSSNKHRSFVLLWLHISISQQTSKEGCYHFANVQSRCVRPPADGPQKAVHFLNGSDLLLVILLLRVSGDDCHLQSFVCFTHRLHLRILPKIYTRVLQLFGAVCAYEAVKVPQNLHREYKSA